MQSKVDCISGEESAKAALRPLPLSTLNIAVNPQKVCLNDNMNRESHDAWRWLINKGNKSKKGAYCL